MKRIDAHVHFWEYEPAVHSWIGPDMPVLKRHFLPEDLHAVLQAGRMDGCVLVQVNQAESENDFFLRLASANHFIEGIVGWVDLCAPDLEERLSVYASIKKIKGFRHILQDDADRASMLKPAFQKGIGMLQRFGFSYDLLIRPDQLNCAARLAKAFPGQRFILDHIAKPLIRTGEIESWEREIRHISQMENVCCKLSGMVTEADWTQWSRQTFRPYMDVVVEAFGTGRMLFGSDWPVCLLAGSYGSVLDIAEDYFSGFSENERENIFGGNALAFYGLSTE